MDKSTLNKRIFAGNFVENNGSVLRTLNTLQTKFKRLKDIQYALNHIKKADIENSVNYLFEAKYLHLRTIDGRLETSLADSDFDDIEAKLTDKGIKLLAGIIEDECVEV